MKAALYFFILATACGAASSQDLDPLDVVFRPDIDSSVAGQTFGERIDSDGPWAVVGAPEVAGQDGRVYLFRYDNGSWDFIKEIVAPTSISNPFRFGFDVAIHGEWLAATTQSGEIALYQRDLGGVDNWGYSATVTVADTAAYRDADFRNTLSLHGNVLAVGSPTADLAPFAALNETGLVSIFRNSGAGWSLDQTILPPVADQIADANFGLSIAVTSNILVIGSPEFPVLGIAESGKAWVYREGMGDGDYTYESDLTSDTPEMTARFGTGVSASGGWIAVGAPLGAGDLTPALTNDGSIYLFEQSMGMWTLSQEVIPSQPDFLNEYGHSVVLSGDLMWSADEDATYLHRRGDMGWTEVDRTPAPMLSPPSQYLQFGREVAFARFETALVGLVGDRIAEDATGTRVGAVAVYSFDDGLFKDGFEG